jgi:hypothetical protein
MPRWVVAFLLTGAILAALLVLALATGHGPGRHLSASPITLTLVDHMPDDR